jgi:hypothetical protein
MLKWKLKVLGKTIRENMKIATKDNLHYYELRKHLKLSTDLEKISEV